MIFRSILLPACLQLCLLLVVLTLSFDARFGNSSDPWGQLCPNDTTYDSSSITGRTYRTNLDFLLSNLTSNAASGTNNGFYNFTSGSSRSGVVYGLFLCRGDVSASACGECVATASSEILSRCPDRNEATIWYDDCLLRYSNQSIFSRMDTSVPLYSYIPQNATDTVVFNRVLEDTLNKVATTAANDDSGKKFAVEEANYSTFQRTIYALGQCTPDLSSFDCETCLNKAISIFPGCCLNFVGATAMNPSCILKYDTTRFYDILTPTPPPNLPPSGKDNGRISTRTTVAIVVPIFVAIVLFTAICCIVMKSRKDRSTAASGISDKAALQYSLSEIRACTNNFGPDNRIGEGGFGAVYKGTLPNGQVIAVKRSSRNSAHGTREFINEIELVAKLQHRNLVGLLGYCLEGGEKILIYEFVPNKSLDHFLFGVEDQPSLDWPIRYKIIEGIVKGLVYLHEDSRLKIIHRDLKAGNVLLDENMNPKIADFGTARLFEMDQSVAKTIIVAGTLGYMAPEYAYKGLLSVKSDVFSFGVLVLEIVSGKQSKNVSFFESHGANNLLSYAWRHWRDETPLTFVDPSIRDSIRDSCTRNKVIQSIQIGLLCVQDDAKQRPTMASVVQMMKSGSVVLPTPNLPAFYVRSTTENFPRQQPSESGESSSTTKSL